MKKITLPCLALITSINSIAQVVFEKGYIITSDSVKQECLIRNKDWFTNPEFFDYKFKPDDEVIQGSTSTVQEFKVYGYSTYVKAVVDIDLSLNTVGALTNSRAPEFQHKELFLKVVVDGPASLYTYRTTDIERFFFAGNNVPITQLIYKKYYVNDDFVGENKDYLSQLKSNVSCAQISTRKSADPKYERKALEKYFNEVNACNSGTVATEERKNKSKSKFNLYITPGINYSTMTVDDRAGSLDIEFSDKVTFRIGAEAEIVFGFNKNKWAFLIEPSYHYYKDETDAQKSVDLAYIEFPFGVRHYFHLKGSSVFINALFLPWKDILLKDDIVTRVGYEKTMDIDLNPSFAFGVGAKKGMFKTELRAYTQKNFLAGYTNWSTDYLRYDCVIGLRIK
jgi:hypothetical protein